MDTSSFSGSDEGTSLSVVSTSGTGRSSERLDRAAISITGTVREDDLITADKQQQQQQQQLDSRPVDGGSESSMDLQSGSTQDDVYIAGNEILSAHMFEREEGDPTTFVRSQEMLGSNTCHADGQDFALIEQQYSAVRPGAEYIPGPSFSQDETFQVFGHEQISLQDMIMVEGVLVGDSDDGDPGHGHYTVDPSRVDSFLRRLVSESLTAEVTGVGTSLQQQPPDRDLTSQSNSQREGRFSVGRKRFCIFYGISIIFVAVIVVVVIFMLTDGRKRSDSWHTLAPKNNTTAFQPAGGPSKDQTQISTFVRAFTRTEELYSAVDAYLQNKSSSSEVAVKYGYPIGFWNVSLISNFSHLFASTRNPNMIFFHEDLSGWDMARATSLKSMFEGSSNFDSDLCSWNVSRAVDMSWLFKKADSFSGNLSSWNVLRVRNMDGMFQRAKSFRGDLASWNTSAVTSMSYMFASASKFDSDLSRWDVSNVKSMAFLFHRTKTFKNRDLSSWDVSSVSDMTYAFHRASSFFCDLSAWNVSSVLKMRSMFQNALIFNSDLSDWDISHTKDMAYMFSGASSFNQNLCSWGKSLSNNTKVVVQGMFLRSGCPEKEEPVFGLVPSGGRVCHRCQT